MSVGWVYHDDFLAHDTGPAHPERPDRLRAVARAFEASGLTKKLTRIDPKPIEPARLHRIHTAEHVNHMAALSRRAPAYADGDTPLSPKSYDVALLATGGVIEATEAVMAGKVKRAFS